MREAASTTGGGAGSGPSAHVLVVEDEDRFRAVITLLLRDEYAVETARSMAEAVARLRSGAEYDVILSDVMMPGGSGVDLYEWISHELPRQARRVVFMSGGLSDPLRERIERLPNDCLEKPFELGLPRSVLRRSVAETQGAP